MSTEEAHPLPPPPPPVEDVPPRRPPTEGSRGTAPSDPTVPPRQRATGQTESKAPKTRTPPLQKKLEEFFAAPALLFSFTGDDYPAQIVAMRTPLMAEAWYELSKQNPGVKRILERITEGGAWGMVAMSSAAVLIPIAQYYQIIPGADPFAVIMPDQTPAAPHRIPPPPTAPAPPPPPTPEAPAAMEPQVEDGVVTMAPPIAPGEPPGVVTVKGSGAVLNGGAG